MFTSNQPVKGDNLKQASQQWYAHWRKPIRNWIKKHSDSERADFLIAIPDLFMLCVGLIGDARVPSSYWRGDDDPARVILHLFSALMKNGKRLFGGLWRLFGGLWRLFGGLWRLFGGLWRIFRRKHVSKSRRSRRKHYKSRRPRRMARYKTVPIS